jgi:hypothetical protein
MVIKIIIISDHLESQTDQHQAIMALTISAGSLISSITIDCDSVKHGKV